MLEESMRVVFRGRLRAARKMRGLTQQRLGQRIGLPHSSISHFERGTRSPALRTFINLALSLNVSTDYLLGIGDDR